MYYIIGGSKYVRLLVYLLDIKGCFKMKWLVDSFLFVIKKKGLVLGLRNYYIFRLLLKIVKWKISKINIWSSKLLFVN